MPSFGKTISGLQQLGSALDGAAEKANNAMGVIGQAKGAADEMRAALDELDAKADDTARRQGEVRDEIGKTAAEITALQTIYDAVGDRQNAFSQDVQLQIEAVRIGAQSLQDFLSVYGDAIIMLEDGQHRIRDLFEGVDYNAYQQQIQDLIEGVQKGGVELADVLAYLQKNAANLAKGLIEAIQKFQAGQIKIEQLIALLQRYKQDFEGDPLGDLAGSLLQGVLGGQLT